MILAPDLYLYSSLIISGLVLHDYRTVGEDIRKFINCPSVFSSQSSASKTGSCTSPTDSVKP